jgi:hypothetical protein
MAHPMREPYVEELLARLDRPVDVIWDTGEPSADKPKLWRVARAAWRVASGDWHLLLQDDALPCRDLLAGLERALDEVPADVGIVSPYLGALRPHTSVFVGLVAQAEAEAASWIREAALWWGVSICVRSASIPAMLAYCDQQTYLADDTRLARYYRIVARQDTLYTWPSLVDHRDGPSLVSHPSGEGRQAHRWHDGSALDLDWTGPVTDHPAPSPGRVPAPVLPDGPRAIVVG